MAAKRARTRPPRVHKPGAGRPKLYDPGPPPEAVAKRRLLAGDGDPAKTATPLDILETRGLITPAQSDAGRVYGWLRRRIFGRTETRALDLLRVSGGVESLHMDEQDLERQYRELRAVLEVRGTRIREITADTCIYNRLPMQILAPTSIEGRRLLGALRDGLDCLDRARNRTFPRRRGPPETYRQA